MIRLDHVYKGFNGNAVLEDISLALPEKGFCAITGRSGRGKTTLLYLIAGLYKPDRGSIQRNGETISMAAALGDCGAERRHSLHPGNCG